MSVPVSRFLIQRNQSTKGDNMIEMSAVTSVISYLS